MEVILREHVDNLGRRGEVVKVANGYARNYLLPRKLALPATPANMKVVERQRKIVEAHEAAERADAESFASRLAQVEIVMARRVGEHDALYGSVTSSDIAEDLAGKGIEIEAKKLTAVEAARVDFDTETLYLTVRIDHKLRLKTLRKALHMASDRVNLGEDYFVGRITFIP